MMSDCIEGALIRINEHTQERVLLWRPISEYIDYFSEDNLLTERITMFRVNEFIELYEDKSFFVKKGDSVLALLNYQETSAIDGKVTNEYELLGIFCGSYNVIKIPPYIDGGLEELQASILEYWHNKEAHYSLDASDMLEFLDQF